MLFVSCRDVAIDCEFIGRANNEGELMMQLIDHIVKTHRAKIAEIMKPELGERVRANTKKVNFCEISNKFVLYCGFNEGGFQK